MLHNDSTPSVSNNTKLEGTLQEEKFFKTGEAAEFLHVTKMTINRWIKNGIIVPAKISKGGHNFFTKQQLIKFSNGNIKIENVENVTSQNVTLEFAQESKNITKSREIDMMDKIYNPDGDIISCTFSDDDEDEEQELLDQLANESEPPEPHKVCVTAPVNKHIPNDKTRKTTFTFMPSKGKMTKKVTLNLNETSLKNKKKGIISSVDVVTKINIFYPDNAILDRPPLKPFDGEVLDACISIQAAGNKFTTIDTIYRCMIGSSDKRKQPSPIMEKVIKLALDKLLFCKVRIDLTDACKRLGYNKGKPVILHNSFIPGFYVENVEVNGKLTTVIEFYEPSPLFKIAQIKNGQIISYPTSLLDTPGYNTPDIIVIKNYMLRRMWESIKHKQMRPILTFKDIFEKAQLFNLSRKQRGRFYQQIEEILDFWVQQDFLVSYKFVTKNKAFYSIHFVANPNFKNAKENF